MSIICVRENNFNCKYNKTILCDLASNALIDGTPGDGTTIGNCPEGYGDIKCLATGECKVCGLICDIQGVCLAEGCDIDSINPVCDADSTTFIIEDSATEKFSQCAKCTKLGKSIKNL